MTDKYEIIQQDIISKIDQGFFVTDKPLPTELEMVDYYNVSRTTVRRAMKDLVSQGLLERIAGKGTFVATADPQKLREEKMRQLEEILQTAADRARENGVSLEELTQILTLIYQEGR